MGAPDIKKYRIDMDFRRYQHFITVAETGSFARAAAQLRMKQPPLSQSIARLERELGVVLFRRTSRAVVLTAAGTAFLSEARIAVASASRAAALARAAGSADSPVRIGVVTPALFEPLPELLRTARAMGIATRLVHRGTNALLVALAAGEVECAFVTPPFVGSERLRVETISDEAVVAALPAAGDGSDSQPVALDAIHRRLMMFPREAGPTLWERVMTMFRDSGLEPDIVAECPADMAATLAMVAAEVGVTIAPPAIARHVPVPGIAFRPFEPKVRAPTWPIALVHLPLSANAPAARLLAQWRR